MGKEELMQKEIESLRKLPEANKSKIIRIAFINIIYAIVFALLCISMSIMHRYLQTELFSLIVKIFAMVLVTLDIVIFEIAYRKDNITIWINSLELLFFSICVLAVPYINLYGEIFYKNFFIIIPIVFVLYYIIKIVIRYFIEKKLYQNTLSDVREIVKDDEKGYL